MDDVRRTTDEGLLSREAIIAFHVKAMLSEMDWLPNSESDLTNFDDHGDTGRGMHDDQGVDRERADPTVDETADATLLHAERLSGLLLRQAMLLDVSDEAIHEAGADLQILNSFAPLVPPSYARGTCGPDWR